MESERRQCQPVLSSWSKAKGVLFRLFQVLVEFCPLHISHYIGFFLSKGRVKFVFKSVSPAKLMLVCGFRVRAQKMKTSTVFPAQTAPFSPSLFCLPLIKVKPLLRAGVSVWEPQQLLFSTVNSGK